MTDTPRQDDSRARVSAQARISPIWIVPLVALMIGAWLIYDNYTSRGPQITLEMPNAEGIEAGTLIKTRNVDVGRVERVSLSEDLSHAEITARLSPGSEPMLVEDTRFWVVKPRIGREGISGLGTVLSGAYLQLQPGSSDASQRHFRVLDLPPASPADAEGLRITLISQLGNSLRLGDPVTYQGYTVGRVESAEFDPEARRMRHRLFIERPYDTLVTDSTRFWSASGVDLRLDSEGFRVSIESFEALLGGGVTFGVLEDLPPGNPVSPDATFSLYPDEEGARQGTFNRYLEYVLLVDDTVRGLSRGAPVEFRGVRIGTVAAVPWRFSAPQPDGRQGFAIPVLIRIEPQRLGGEGELDLEAWRERFERLFGLGLRASLKAGNLLTGALFVDINFQRDGEAYVAETFESRRVFPTTSGGLAQIEQKVSSLLDKLNALEVEPILDGLATNLAGTEALVGEVRQLTERVGGLLDSPETQALPGNVNRALESLQQTLEGASPGGEGYQELIRTLERFERLMRDMQPVLRTLDEDPRALLFDRDGSDPQPRAPRP
ncbi:intermembrane transport protein PqiB [Halomonas sp. 328]|uniref:intermembrane transport protein PqiB n=1 Tax=Halomonas sp. 328 TaxID=2776704 RepID=UPI0018A77BB7|nr:intermembrane transport protein PqiB [Halomonas sp. 328]MBF8222134.1 intermembrane transport protein PqiB [Halomonas sp. 328]